MALDAVLGKVSRDVADEKRAAARHFGPDVDLDDAVGGVERRQGGVFGPMEAVGMSVRAAHVRWRENAVGVAHRRLRGMARSGACSCRR